MSASTISARGANAPVAAKSHALRQLTIAEFKLSLREPRRLAGMAIPIVLLIILGFIPTFNTPSAKFGGFTPLDSYVPIVILMSMGLMAIAYMPMVLAGYREHGILRRMRTTPAGPARVLAAYLIINVISAAVSVILVVALARGLYNVPFARQQVGFLLSLLLAVVAVQAIGLFVAAVSSTTMGAQVFGGVLFFPLLFFSGLWFPIPLMSPGLRDVSHATPLGAAWAAMSTSAAGHWPPLWSLGTLVAYTVVCGFIAVRSFRWE